MRRPRWRCHDLDGDGLSLLMRRVEPTGDFVESTEIPGLMVPRQLGERFGQRDIQAMQGLLVALHQPWPQRGDRLRDLADVERHASPQERQNRCDTRTGVKLVCDDPRAS